MRRTVLRLAVRALVALSTPAAAFDMQPGDIVAFAGATVPKGFKEVPCPTPLAGLLDGHAKCVERLPFDAPGQRHDWSQGDKR
jgi:hypothetical protein